MKRSVQEIQRLVREYEHKMSEAPVPVWMDAPDILDILDYYEQRNMYYESEYCMRLALRLHPRDPEVLMRRAYRLKNEGRWAEATEIVESMEDQSALDVQFFLAEKALCEVRVDDAERHFVAGLTHEREADAQMVLSGEGDPIGDNDLLLEVGEIFMDYGCVKRAWKFLKLVKEGPEFPRANLLMAECAYQLGQVDDAIKFIDIILDADPYYLDAWILKADLLNETKRWKECAEAAEYAIAIEPTNEKALRFKACAALGLKDYQTVLDVYAEYSELYPNDFTMALSAGEILLYRKQYQEAYDVLCRSNRNCPNDNPDKVRIVTDIAITFSARHDMSRAYETLLGICSLGKTHGDVLFNAANQAFDYKEVEFGHQALQHLLEHTEMTQELRYQLAQMLCEHNLFGEVTDLWENLLTVKVPLRVTAAPYLAYAARRLMRVSEYKFWLSYAVYNDSTLTHEVFRHVYPNSLPQDYLVCARNEFPE